MNNDLAESAIKAELRPNEVVIWCGQPAQGFHLQSSDLFLIPFSLLWGGFACFWEYGVLSSKAPFFFCLFGIPFVIVGLYMIFGRFIVDAKVRSTTYYGLTSQRAIIISGLMSRETKSINLMNIDEISLTKRSDGSGAIQFGRAMWPYQTFTNNSWPGMNRARPPAFDAIEDVQDVYNKIQTLKSGSA
jgi:hypothetical protein